MKLVVIKEWFKYAVSRISDYQGRAGRKEYASFLIGQVVIFGLCFILDEVFSTFPAFTGVYLAFTFVPACLLVVRRLHDCGYTGKWAVPIVIFFPALLILLFIPSDPAEPNAYGFTERLIYKERDFKERKPQKSSVTEDDAMIDFVNPQKAIRRREKEREKVQDKIKQIEREEAKEAYPKSSSDGSK